VSIENTSKVNKMNLQSLEWKLTGK
jgi:hypothetical protein